MPCSQYEALFVSAAHSEADIDATLAAARKAWQHRTNPSRSKRGAGADRFTVPIASFRIARLHSGLAPPPCARPRCRTRRSTNSS